jgi:hypothetical protein
MSGNISGSIEASSKRIILLEARMTTPLQNNFTSPPKEIRDSGFADNQSPNADKLSRQAGSFISVSSTTKSTILPDEGASTTGNLETYKTTGNENENVTGDKRLNQPITVEESPIALGSGNVPVSACTMDVTVIDLASDGDGSSRKRTNSIDNSIDSLSNESNRGNKQIKSSKTFSDDPFIREGINYKNILSQ